MPKSPTPITVSQLNRQAKQALEGTLPNVWVQGELTNLAKPSSGHWYFTLKDARAQVRCAMFRGRNMLLRTPINAGDQVVVNASVSLYEGRGDYQLIVDSLQKAGLGDLHQQYEALREKLTAEGLFNPEHKQAIPAFAERIGVISSPTGAAVHDILTVLKRRHPYAEVVIYPAIVQGSDAPLSLINALKLAHQHKYCELLIIGRGGGSLEDLWAFNDERVVRAVAASKLPIISAVGHEVDVTLSDFAADLRAATPSAAAEAATPSSQALFSTLTSYQSRLMHLMRSQLLRAKQETSHLTKRLVHPKSALLAHKQQLDFLEVRLRRAFNQNLSEQQKQLASLTKRLELNNPKWQLQTQRNALNALQETLTASFGRILAAKRQCLQHRAALLNNLSPLNTLQRGYAITRNENGRVISHKAELKAGQAIRITYADGEATAKVIEP